MRSIVITGLPRSGTTLAASIFARIGVPMVRPVETIRGMGRRYEHPELRQACEQEDFERVARISREFVEQRGTWAWKLPMLRHHLGTIEAIVPNAAFVLVMRGPAGRWHAKSARFAQATEAPVLLFSYDAAMADLDAAISTCAGFAGIPALDMHEVIAGIRDDHANYRVIDPEWIRARNRRLWPDHTLAPTAVMNACKAL